MTIEILQRLALALGIGLLIGVERGWKEREGRDGSRAAGIRTHTLIGLLGGVWGLIGAGNDLTLGLGALGFILGFAAFEWREAKESGNVSGTGFVAVVLAFSLGIYCAHGDMLAAASSGVIATVILAEREALHRFLSSLKWIELRDGLLLLVMSVVLLPLMPNQPIDPWGALNPFQIWLVTILLAAMSYGGYIAVRLVGAERGPLFAGLAGGLVSSTTVTWTFARLAKAQPAAHAPLMTGILASWIVSLMRMTGIAVAIAPVLFVPLIRVTGTAAVVFAIVAAYTYNVGRAQKAKGALKLEHPFELLAILKFAGLLVAIMLLSKWIAPLFGSQGLFGLAFSSGLADVDPVTFSMAQLAGISVSVNDAANIILTAALANLLAKCGFALAFGKARFAVPLILTAAGGIAVGASLVSWPT